MTSTHLLDMELTKFSNVDLRIYTHSNWRSWRSCAFKKCLHVPTFHPMFSKCWSIDLKSDDWLAQSNTPLFLTVNHRCGFTVTSRHAETKFFDFASNFSCLSHHPLANFMCFRAIIWWKSHFSAILWCEFHVFLRSFTRKSCIFYDSLTTITFFCDHLINASRFSRFFDESRGVFCEFLIKLAFFSCKITHQCISRIL